MHSASTTPANRSPRSAGAPSREWLERKYAEERAKRLRPDGINQYVRLSGQFAHYASDPYTPFTKRPPVSDHVTFAFVGGGFAGLVTGARLVEAGVSDVRIVDKGGDFGGTWYWNRYPGAQCDTASYIYMPLLEETRYMPTEKYAHGPEILEHCRRIGRHYGLYSNALFHTEVVDLRWLEEDCCWMVSTDRGDRFTAQFIGIGTGPLHVPKLPGIPGMDTFEGHAFHTSRWDYSYTGGDELGAPLSNLSDKKVAIIGTGASAIQCISHLARAAKELYVFQRTPSSVDVRANQPTDPEWFAQIATPGWQKRWLENFAANQTGMPVDDDLVMDGWTDIARRIRSRVMSLPPSEITMERIRAAWEDADYEKMEEIRSRIDGIVKDPETAWNLKAWYRQLCKRPCFHDEYLEAFNEPGCHLVHTDGKGVQRIVPDGVVFGGTTYEVDCIIYASGFEVGTDFTSRAGFDMTGEGGLRLSQHWAGGMRTMHGIHVCGFPNAFMVQPTQGAFLISNIPHNLTESASTIAAVVSHALDRGARKVKLTPRAEQAWVELLLKSRGNVLSDPSCTPGYYNNEGQQPPPSARYNVGYPFGAVAFFSYLDKWRESGEFDGLVFS